MKKILNLCLIIVFLAIIGVFVGSCEEEATEDDSGGFAYELINGNTEYSISLGKAVASGEIKLPASYKGLSVTAIANNAFASCINLKGVTIPDKVTKIGDNAFQGCTSLVKVTFTSTISVSNFSYSSFPGDLRDKYIAEGIGTYSRTSGNSTTWTGTVPAGIPVGVSAMPADFSSINVRWSSLSGATGYVIFRSTSSSGYFSSVGTSSTTSFTDTGLTPSTTYYYKVAASNSGGAGEQSSIVNATTSSFIIEMVQISAGTFTMGSPTSEANRRENETQHQVTISKGFYMGKYEVTQEQYQVVTGRNPSYFSGDPTLGEVQTRRPVEQVTWYDAVEFCNKLSVMEGLTLAYTITDATVTVNWNASGYRLPTEAEWEYACRAGKTTAYNTGNIISNNTGWYSSNSNYMTHEVGRKSPNAWGLYDMHGNVWEWCWDRYETYASGATDPTGAASGSSRVLRGGSWNDNGQELRSARRASASPSYYYPHYGDHHSHFGFRLLRP